MLIETPDEHIILLTVKCRFSMCRRVIMNHYGMSSSHYINYLFDPIASFSCILMLCHYLMTSSYYIHFIILLLVFSLYVLAGCFIIFLYTIYNR